MIFYNNLFKVDTDCIGSNLRMYDSLHPLPELGDLTENE